MADGVSLDGHTRFDVEGKVGGAAQFLSIGWLVAWWLDGRDTIAPKVPRKFVKT